MSGLSFAPHSASRQLLLVEDDSATAELVRRTLERVGYSVEVAPSVQAGMKALNGGGSKEYLAMLLDYKLPDGEPWEVANAAKARVPEIPVIFVTGESNESVAIEAVRRGFADYVKKTAGFWDELPAVLERVATLSRIKGHLDESNALMRTIVEHTSELVAVSTGEGNLVYLSPMCLSLLGRDPKELIGHPCTDFVAPEDRDAVLGMMDSPGENSATAVTVRCCRKDGSYAWVEVKVSRLETSTWTQPMIVLTLHDVTAHREHDQQMQSTLREKEVLLREVYHRVKNNLQVIQSLLKMSARTLPTGEMRDLMTDTIQRVHAMALVHERLYQMDDLAHLSLSSYLLDLFEGALSSSSMQPGQVHIGLDAEDIRLTLDGAIPFGLLLNELLSNSLKHGFPGGRRGTVDVSIHRVSDAVHLVVKDDGIGLPEHFKAEARTSMGMKLAASLAHQLGGSLVFASDNGCKVEANLTRL
jgi:PAS domain S-box-containing protein